MKKSALMSVGMLVLSVSTVLASVATFHDPFNNNLAETWYPIVYENGAGTDTLCGVSACGELVKEGNEKFFQFQLNSNATYGVYSDLELRSSARNEDYDEGPWTPTVDHPVVLESRIRMGAGHNFDGSGGAVGTKGVGLWNNAEGDNAPSPEYDAMTFSWIDDDFTDLFGVDGFSAATAVNLFPVNRARPTTPINMEEWNDVKIHWSVDGAGVQTVEYFVNNESIGAYQLPVALKGLSVVVWQDNQVFDDTFQIIYKVPTFTQTFDVDYVKVHQL